MGAVTELTPARAAATTAVLASRVAASRRTYLARDSVFILLCCLLRCAELLGTADSVQQNHAAVHAQDRIGNAFVVAAEVTDHDGQDTAADAVDDLTQLGNGGVDLVGCHEDGTQHQTAAEDLSCHPGITVIAHGEQEGQNSNSADVSHGDPGSDDLAVQQIDEADE